MLPAGAYKMSPQLQGCCRRLRLRFSSMAKSLAWRPFRSLGSILTLSPRNSDTPPNRSNTFTSPVCSEVHVGVPKCKKEPHRLRGDGGAGTTSQGSSINRLRSTRWESSRITYLPFRRTRSYSTDRPVALPFTRKADKRSQEIVLTRQCD